MSVDPPACNWEFPPAESADEHGIVGVGADLAPGTLLGAYRRGLFPMPIAGARAMAWWSPDPRGVIELDGLRVTRSMRQSARRYEIRFDTAFPDVIDACREAPRAGGWISNDMYVAYVRLHELGWAHSVEAWTPDGELAGGLYGVAIGGLFAGESMFHRARDASKVALMGLVAALREGDGCLLDVQWATPHLLSLGASEISRSDYLIRVAEAVRRPAPPVFSAG